MYNSFSLNYKDRLKQRKYNKKLCKVIKLKIAEIKKQKTFYLLPKFFKKY